MLTIMHQGHTLVTSDTQEAERLAAAGERVIVATSAREFALKLLSTGHDGYNPGPYMFYTNEGVDGGIALGEPISPDKIEEKGNYVGLLPMGGG
jgi:hypothetical protein